MPPVVINPAALAAVLSTPLAVKAMGEVAEKLAEDVRQEVVLVSGEPGDYEIPVATSTRVEGTARSSVRLAHPAGQAVQAKHGVLTKAAAQAGLDVKAGS